MYTAYTRLVKLVKLEKKALYMYTVKSLIGGHHQVIF